jgi:hypothetical protein
MKATKRIIAGVSLLAIAGLIIYVNRRRKKITWHEQATKEVAEHGYETAHDILFPQSKRKRKYRPL